MHRNALKERKMKERLEFETEMRKTAYRSNVSFFTIIDVFSYAASRILHAQEAIWKGHDVQFSWARSSRMAPKLCKKHMLRDYCCFQPEFGESAVVIPARALSIGRKLLKTALPSRFHSKRIPARHAIWWYTWESPDIGNFIQKYQNRYMNEFNWILRKVCRSEGPGYIKSNPDFQQ